MTMPVKPFYSDNNTLKVTEWCVPSLQEKSSEEKKIKEEQERIRFEKEITELKENTYKEAFSQGEQAGFETGKNEVTAIINRLITLENQLSDPLMHLTEDILQFLKNIIVTITKSVLVDEIKTEPEKIEKILKEIIVSLNDTKSKIYLQCSPSDIEITQKYFNNHVDNKVKIEANASISAGGYIVSTEHSYLDATVETRIKQLVDHYFTKDIENDVSAFD